MNNVNNFFAALDGATKGGCDKCDAEMELQNRFGIWHMTIKHDDWCPVLRRHQRQHSRTKYRGEHE